MSSQEVECSLEMQESTQIQTIKSDTVCTEPAQLITNNESHKIHSEYQENEDQIPVNDFETSDSSEEGKQEEVSSITALQTEIPLDQTALTQPIEEEQINNLEHESQQISDSTTNEELSKEGDQEQAFVKEEPLQLTSEQIEQLKEESLEQTSQDNQALPTYQSEQLLERREDPISNLGESIIQNQEQVENQEQPTSLSPTKEICPNEIVSSPTNNDEGQLTQTEEEEKVVELALPSTSQEEQIEVQTVLEEQVVMSELKDDNLEIKNSNQQEDLYELTPINNTFQNQNVENEFELQYSIKFEQEPTASEEQQTSNSVAQQEVSQLQEQPKEEISVAQEQEQLNAAEDKEREEIQQTMTQIQSENQNNSTQFSDQTESTGTTSVQQNINEDVLKLVDDFFNQIESETNAKVQSKRRSIQTGKENECNNTNKYDEDYICSPEKKRSRDSQQTADDEKETQQSPGKQDSIEPEQQQSSCQTQLQDDSLAQAKRLLKDKLAESINQQMDQENTSSDIDSKNQEAQLSSQPSSEDASQRLNSKQSSTKESSRSPFTELMNTKKKQSENQQSKDGQKRVSRLIDVNKVIYVDSYILNYSNFFPGKLLGSTLNVGNLTNSEQIVELAIDSNSFQYNKKAISEKFGNPELPYSLDASVGDEKSDGKKQETIVNSEIKHESWYIENPISKELTKRITLKLGPKAEQDFIIVVRSPNAKKTENLMSIINIGLLTYSDEQFGVKESFEDFLKTNYNNSMKEFLRDRKKVAQQQRIEILLAGRIEVPSLVCQRELLMTDFNEKVIPLVVKKGQPNQKFRIPFKNTGPQDLDIDFTFVKTANAVLKGNLSRSNSTTNDELQRQNSLGAQQSPIEFSAIPSNMKISSNGTAILNIGAKLKNSYQLMSINKEGSAPPSKQRAEKYNHLLIAKVKDTQIMFSFILEVSLLENNGNSNTMS